MELKEQIKQTGGKAFKLRFLAILLISMSMLITSGCKVIFVPAYDSQIAAQIDETAKIVDKFYLSMLETTTIDNDGRAYTKFAEQYVVIEAELNSLLNKNKIRPLNQNSIRITEITLQLWQKYKEEHKVKNKLSDGLIKLDQKTFSELFYAMQVAEQGKNIINHPPQ